MGTSGGGIALSEYGVVRVITSEALPSSGLLPVIFRRKIQWSLGHSGFVILSSDVSSARLCWVSKKSPGRRIVGCSAAARDGDFYPSARGVLRRDWLRE